MDEKKLAISLLILPIGLHAKYPWNAVMISLALFVVLIELLWHRKKYSNWMIVSLLVIWISAFPVLAAILGKFWDNRGGFIQLLIGVGGMLCGIMLMGVSNYVQNPNPKTKKVLKFIVFWFVSILLICLLMWYFTVTKNN